MGELVEGALDAEVGAEGEREDRGVGRQVAAGVVADEQDRPLLGDVPQASDLAAEPEAGEQPDLDEVYDEIIARMQRVLDALAAERTLPVLG